MSQDLEILTEAVAILTQHALATNSALCGSSAGRRLQEIHRTITPPRLGPLLPSCPIDENPLVGRLVDLGIAEDTALANLATSNGVSRDYLIRMAVTLMLNHWRTTGEIAP